VDHPFALARALLDLGDCSALTGRRFGAEQALREAGTIFERLGATPSLQRTERALAAIVPNASFTSRARVQAR
jgi:hypothetical protein